MDDKEVRYDIDGYEEISVAVDELLNQYPALEDDVITFASIDGKKGKAFYPVSGAIIQKETRSITGHIKQTCMYPFTIVYRTSTTSEAVKMKVKEWLDNLGKWLEKQEVLINNTPYKLENYPPLQGNRVITDIQRMAPSYQAEPNADGSEDWVIPITLYYRNEYDR